ncbi:MAG: hypothetical protein M3O28_05345 [Actinomycetota bacterium]|nr:hypothetical protein [Actinomycetota bacterium]
MAVSTDHERRVRAQPSIGALSAQRLAATAGDEVRWLALIPAGPIPVAVIRRRIPGTET